MLKMETKILIKTLAEIGVSKTKIGEKLGIHRKTVEKILKKGIENEQNRSRNSIIDPYKDYIAAKVENELSATRIYQDLVKEKGYEGSYETVKNLVRDMKQNKQKVYMRIHTQPGEEAQVDFGYAGPIIIENKKKKCWVFCMELSYSRLEYFEIVYDQAVKTFLQCHINAFHFFGGVPKIIKIDNLKSAILEANFYDTIYQKEYLNFANHYSFKPMPCRIGTPTDKGKVEANIKYVKNNFLKSRLFRDKNHANEELRNWNINICNKRTHNTTKQVPQEVFDKEERMKLLPLPSKDFEIAEFVKRKVGIDCHINFENNYYSVPYQYIAQEVIVEVTDNLLRIYANNNIIATHPRLEGKKGEFQTTKNHYPSYKTLTNSDYYAHYKQKMANIGEDALKFYQEMVKIKNYGCYGAIRGIIALTKTYGEEAVNKACRRALHHQAFEYRVIKSICEKQLYEMELEKVRETNIEAKGEFARPLSEYQRLLD
jgi:transposase